MDRLCELVVEEPSLQKKLSEDKVCYENWFQYMLKQNPIVCLDIVRSMSGGRNKIGTDSLRQYDSTPIFDNIK